MRSTVARSGCGCRVSARNRRLDLHRSARPAGRRASERLHDRAEDFLRERSRGRSTKAWVRRSVPFCAARAAKAMAHRPAAASLRRAFERLARSCIDHRPDVGRRIARIADDERLRRACDHAQDARSRCPPAGTAPAMPSSAVRRCRTPMPTSVTTCSASAELSTIIAFFRRSRRSAARSARPRGERPAIVAADRCRPVNATPAMRGSFTSAGPTVPAPGSSASAVGRHAGCEQQRDGPCRDQWGLFGRLGDDGVACGECRCDLTGEDRQRKVPRRHAANTPRPPSVQVFARRSAPAAQAAPRSRGGHAARTSGNDPQLHAVRRRHPSGSCRPPAPAGTELLARRLDQVRGTLQHRSTVRSARGIPVTPAARQLVDCGADLVRRRIIDCTDQNATIGGTTDLPFAPGGTISRAMDRRQQRRRSSRDPPDRCPPNSLGLDTGRAAAGCVDFAATTPAASLTDRQ